MITPSAQKQLFNGQPTTAYVPGGTLGYPEHGNYLVVLSKENDNNLPTTHTHHYFEEFEVALKEFFTQSELLAQKVIRGIVSVSIIHQEGIELIDFFVSPEH